MLKRAIISPFTWGIITGLLSNNLSLGLITAALCVLIAGYQSDVNFIIILTVFTVVLSGNINFEIIFLFYLSLAFLLKENKFFAEKNKITLYTIAGLFSLFLLPFWSLVFEVIPVQILEEINIAGIFFLLCGLVLTFKRGIKLLTQNEINHPEILILLTVFLLSILAIAGTYLILPIWIIGIWFIDFLKKQKKKILFPRTVYLILFLLIINIAVFYLLPFNYLMIFVFAFLISLLWNTRKALPVLEIVYISFFLGLIAGRIGFLV